MRKLCFCLDSVTNKWLVVLSTDHTLINGLAAFPVAVPAGLVAVVGFLSSAAFRVVVVPLSGSFFRPILLVTQHRYQPTATPTTQTRGWRKETTTAINPQLPSLPETRCRKKPTTAKAPISEFPLRFFILFQFEDGLRALIITSVIMTIDMAINLRARARMGRIGADDWGFMNSWVARLSTGILLLLVCLLLGSILPEWMQKMTNLCWLDFMRGTFIYWDSSLLLVRCLVFGCSGIWWFEGGSVQFVSYIFRWLISLPSNIFHSRRKDQARYWNFH